MAQSIGQKLAAARKRRDLTIEDIAHQTRIPADTLRQLEADDYSQFANLTYAKSFLSMYSKHLGLDIADYLKEFGFAGQSGLEGVEFVDGFSSGHRDSDVFAPLIDPPRRYPFAAAAALLFFIVAIPGMYFLGRSHGIKTAAKIKAENPRPPATALANPAPRTAEDPRTRTTRRDLQPPSPVSSVPKISAPIAPPSPAASPPPAAATVPDTSDPDAPVVVRRAAVIEDSDEETPPPAEGDETSSPPQAGTVPRAIRPTN